MRLKRKRDTQSLKYSKKTTIRNNFAPKDASNARGTLVAIRCLVFDAFLRSSTAALPAAHSQAVWELKVGELAAERLSENGLHLISCVAALFLYAGQSLL